MLSKDEFLRVVTEEVPKARQVVGDSHSTGWVYRYGDLTEGDLSILYNKLFNEVDRKKEKLNG